jgi:CDP-glucose 4,6-dehydratase
VAQHPARLAAMSAPSLNAAFWRDRNVFVTGATGLLGSWLCDGLVRAGAIVTALIRDEVPRSNLHRLGLLASVSVVRGSLDDLRLLERALGEYEIDAVFHLAAQTIVGIADRGPISTFDSNIRGTYHVLEAARRSPLVTRIVVASTDKVYGDHGSVAFTEETPLRAAGPYDLSKSCADQLALGLAAHYKMPIVVTRFGNLYGGGDNNWNRIIPGTIRSVLRGDRPVLRSNGLFVRDYIYVKDAVSAYGRLAERCADPDVVGRAFNVSDEAPRTVLQVVDEILKQTGRTDLQPIVQDKASGEIAHLALDAKRARALLDWRSGYTFEQGIAETLQWYREFLASDE